MELSNLRPAKGAVKKSKRIGRGTGSGHGGTSTRGHKGDKARSGAKEKRHFEGGQTPMQRRLPKRGFKNINRIDYTIVSLAALDKMAQKQDGQFDLTTLGKQVKVLSNGKLTTQVSIKVHAISAAAQSAIEALGGSVELV